MKQRKVTQGVRITQLNILHKVRDGGSGNRAVLFVYIVFPLLFVLLCDEVLCSFEWYSMQISQQLR